MCSGVMVAAHSRAMFPVFCGISGSTRATLSMKVCRLRDPSFAGRAKRVLSDSFIVVIEADNVVLPEVIAKLDFDDSQRCVCAVTKAMISLWRNVDVLTGTQLQFIFSTHHVRNAFDHDPMFAATRVALQTESRAGLHFQHFYFKAGPFFQHFVAAPRSLVRFAHRTILPGLGSHIIELKMRIIDCRRSRQSSVLI